jgi:TfoX/Sxy family transcriptional regulator of competence genes
MFGGYGLFHDGAMFGLVNSAGAVHLRVDDATFLAWAADALATAQVAKR